MKSNKTKLVLILIMITASTCFAQSWKNFIKGVEERATGKNSSQSTEQTKDASNDKAKLSNNPTVQKMAACLTKAEIALKAKDYETAADNYNTAVKIKLPSNIDKSDADTLSVWANEIYARLQYQNIKNLKKR